jgi:hypothetical protein
LEYDEHHVDKGFALPGARKKPAEHRNKPLLEEKLLAAGRNHFAKDFPNPKRIGCPSRKKLQQLADNPTRGDESVLNHVSFCSPCYREFSGFLQSLRKKIRSQSKRSA